MKKTFIYIFYKKLFKRLKIHCFTPVKCLTKIINWFDLRIINGHFDHFESRGVKKQSRNDVFPTENFTFLIVDEVTDVISLSLVAKITFPSDYALKLLIKRVGACFLSRAAVSILSRAVFSPRFSGHTRENKIYYRVIPDSRLAFSTRRERGNLC